MCDQKNGPVSLDSPQMVQDRGRIEFLIPAGIVTRSVSQQLETGKILV